MKNNTTSKPQPPRWADKILQCFCAPHLLEEIQGDLHEAFQYDVARIGKRRATWRYIHTVAGFMRPFALRRRPQPSSHYKYSYTAMIRNYTLIAFRNLMRRKVFSAINVAGLSLGLACCMLILLYAKDEITYDRFHKNGTRIYRVAAFVKGEQGIDKLGSTNMPIGPALKQEIAEVETFVRMQGANLVIQPDSKSERTQNEVFNQSIVWADNDFFHVFTMPLIAGNPKTALSELNGTVLTEETARKYFGHTDVLGKTISIDMYGETEIFVVTGVAQNPPQNSSLKFEMLLPYRYVEEHHPSNEWIGFYINTFILLREDADWKAVESKLERVFKGKAVEEMKREPDLHQKVRFTLQPFLDIHLGADYEGTRNGLKDGSNPMYSYILSGLALFILVIACINFVNLTVAQSLKRAKEVGIRKVIGARRTQLLFQFFGESFLLNFAAFVVALGLAQMALPVFNVLANKHLSLSYLLDTSLVAAYTGIFILTSFAAGLYPALVLSGFHPVYSLYGRAVLSGKNYLAKALVVVQFSLATFLIIVTLVIYSQFNYLVNKALGYDDTNVVMVNVGRGASNELVEAFKNELAGYPAIVRAGAKNRGQNYTVGEVAGKGVDFAYDRIDEHYLPVLNIPIVKGRNFSPDFGVDSIQSIIINEAFAKEVGWDDPIGKTVDFTWKNQQMVVVGMVKDYHYTSLREKIGPQIFTMDPGYRFGELAVKIDPRQTSHALNAITKAYQKLLPQRPVEFVFKDEVNKNQYEAEAKWKQIIFFGAVLTVFVSCIGLLGLSTLSAEQRTKEIGIRKVLGASVRQITTLLTVNFLKLVLLAFIFAIPAAYYASRVWLHGFAYRIEIAWWLFAAAGILAALIATITISFQSVKTALVNPVESLRNE